MRRQFGDAVRRLRNLAAIPSNLRQMKTSLEQLLPRVQKIESTSADFDAALARRLGQAEAISGERLHRVLAAQHVALLEGVRQAANGGDVRPALASMGAEIKALEAGSNRSVASLAQEVAALRQQVTVLQRSAAGRGNVLMPDNRLLTRISLPQYFPHGDPILFVNADDKLIVPKLAMNGYYELESSHFVCRNIKPNDHVVDVGANFGYYTAMMGVLVGWKGKIVAFEPQPEMARLLQENTLINWIEPWVKIVRSACSEAPGTMRLHHSKARAVNTGMTVPEVAEGYGPEFAFTAFDVSTVRIDDSLDFLEGRVDFMKIDVEGAEVLALRGAKQTIAANPGIKIMMEWSPGQLQANKFELNAVAAEMKETGLSLFSQHGHGQVGDTFPMQFEALPEAGYQNIVLMRSS